MTTLDLCANVLYELGVLSPGESLRSEDAAFVLAKVNRILDNWNAEYGAVYASDVSTFTLTPNLQPHSIGPSGATWTTALRPVSIEGANLIVAGIRYPIHMRDMDWWMDVRLPGFATTIVYNLNYRPLWPNGECWLWPVPSTAYQIELNSRFVLAALTLAATFTMPPGYEAAVTLTAAEDCAAAFGRPLDPKLVQSAEKARQRVLVANMVTPRLATRDEGLAQAGPGWWDYQSGMCR